MSIPIRMTTPYFFDLYDTLLFTLLFTLLLSPYFFDQDDDTLLVKGVNSLALYVCSCDAFISIDHADYFDRGWCLMECMFADASKTPRYIFTKENTLKVLTPDMKLENKTPTDVHCRERPRDHGGPLARGEFHHRQNRPRRDDQRLGSALVVKRVGGQGTGVRIVHGPQRYRGCLSMVFTSERGKIVRVLAAFADG